MAYFWLLGVWLNKSEFGTDDRHRWSAPMIGTSLIFTHRICNLHVCPKDSAIWVSWPTSIRWCMTSSTDRGCHQSRSNPILWFKTQMVKRQMENCLAHFREWLRTSHYWHVNNSNLISVHVNPLICYAYLIHAKNQRTGRHSLCIVFTNAVTILKAWTWSRFVARLSETPRGNQIQACSYFVLC